MTIETYETRVGSQRVVSGAGAARASLADELAWLGVTRVLLIAGGTQRYLAQRLLTDLDVVATFFDVRPHVPVVVAEAAIATARASDAEVVVAVGGGSTIGTAKAVALTHPLPIVAIPTTFAGSEATDVWGLTEDGQKRNGTDPRVLPRVIVYDPELTTSLSTGMTVSSGLNALAHCIDSLWGPTAAPASDAMAVEGIRLLAQGLQDVVASEADLVARSQCQSGTYLAASAFALAGSGMHHKICHVLGGAFDLEHAAMHASLLPHVLGFNAPAAPDASQRIAQALSLAHCGQGDDALAGLLELLTVVGAAPSLGQLGLRADQVQRAAELSIVKIPASNPRPVSLDQLARLIGRAQAGERPVLVSL